MRRGVVGSEHLLLVIVIGAVTAVALATFTKSYYSSTDDTFTEKQCQASLLKDSISRSTRLFCFNPEKEIAIKCERDFLSVSEGDVFRDGRELTREYDRACPDGYAGDDCLAQNVIAHEMAECWRTMFKGEKALFSAVELNSIKVFSRKDALRACFVCAEVSIDTEIRDFKGYLQKKRLDNEDTYFSYIAENPSAICDRDLETLSPGHPGYTHTCWEGMAYGLEPDWSDSSWGTINYESMLPGRYAISFMRRGLGSCESVDQDDDVGDGYLTYTVQAFPAEKAGDYCTMVIV